MKEERKLAKKLSNKKINAEAEGIKCLLTIDQFKELMDRAGIKAEDIRHNGYHLARYNDTGDYTIDNCRFISYKENLRERKISKKCIEAGKRVGGHNKLTKWQISYRLSLIKKSGIDLSQFGWIKKLSKVLKISEAQTKRFVDKYYKGKVYKRF